MPRALIFDQNAASQALATHALKQLGFEAVARTGDLFDILEELSPELVILPLESASLARLRQEIKKKPRRILFVRGENSDSIAFPNSRELRKPFRSEDLQKELKALISEPISEITADISLKLNDPVVRSVLELGLRARGLEVEGETSEGSVTFVVVTDDNQIGSRDWYRPQHGELIRISSGEESLREKVLLRLSELFTFTPIQIPEMPLSEAERALLSKIVIREIEAKLSRAPALRNRNWELLKAEIIEVLDGIFLK